MDIYINRHFILSLLIILGGLSCKKSEDVLQQPAFFYQPQHFPNPNYTPKAGKEGRVLFQLGKDLFYDPILSSDSSISCGDCHKSIAAFGDPGHRLSHGVGGQLGTRNSPPLFNLAWRTSFMKDGGINHIEVQSIAPIENPVEMNLPLLDALNRIKHNDAYRYQFEQLYGDTLQSAYFLQALATFMSGMISANSKYDRVQEGFDTWSSEEARGEQLFLMHCNDCHTAPLFTNNSFANNGYETNDIGREMISGDVEDRGRFIVPSLRNLKYSKPYFHDGSKNTLNDVLNHYEYNTSTKDVERNIVLSSSERNDLLSFLEALNDPSFINNTELQQ